MIAPLSRRGIAMLLVLVAVLVLSSAGLALVRTAAAFSLSSRRSLFENQARITAHDLRDVLVDWTAKTAGGVAAGPGSPGSDPLNISVDAYAVRIEPIDLAGRLHVRWLADAPAIAMSLPAEYQGVAVPAEFAGLDWKTAEPHERPTLEELLPQSRGMAWNTPSTENDRGDLCRWVTTAGDGSLNMQSAPVELLASALAAAGVRPQDTRRLIEARRSRTPIDPDAAARAIAAAAHRVQDGGAVPLTLRAGPWGFLLTVSQDQQTARWWVEIEEVRATRAGSGRTRWTVTQFRRVP